jgi:hypothetical protein
MGESFLKVLAGGSELRISLERQGHLVSTAQAAHFWPIAMLHNPHSITAAWKIL